MARIRTIKPDFFLDEDLAELGAWHRLLFIGLWTQADRNGRLEDRPKMLKAVVFPYDRIDVDKLLGDLGRDEEFIVRYTVDGKKYIQIKKFLKHQRPHHTEKPSEFPPPLKGDNGDVTVNSPSSNGDTPVGREGKGKEGKGRRVSISVDGFKAFWDRYPKKKSKSEAEKAWKKLRPNEQLQDLIKQKVEQAKTLEEWIKDNGAFIPYPATYLNKRRWEDELVVTLREKDSAYDSLS